MSFENIGRRETLPDRVCRTIKESILKGELKGGDVLPTEPELEKQFGVSRAVIRDAIKMLTAQGLIVVKHGKGMYVSRSQTAAFTDALLTSLRRDNATAWDVEQFEQMFLPQVFALASKEATEEDIVRIKASAQEYIAAFGKMNEAEISKNQSLIRESELETEKTFTGFMNRIFESTHNKLVMLLGEVLVSMRKWRNITDIEEDSSKLVEYERSVIGRFIEAVETDNPQESFKLISKTISYDSNIISIMKNTPVGTNPEIPGDLFFSAYRKLEEGNS